ETVAARFPEARERTRVVPLGVDLQLFEPSVGSAQEMAGLPRPRLGLMGGLDERVDFELLRALALADPNWSVVLVGPVLDIAGAQQLTGLPNVHLIGQRPYERMPEYLSGLDVCLIPYRRTRWTDGCFPAKLHEYMASGRPIVAT